MKLVLILLGLIACIILAIAIWIKVSIWIMGLGITDDNEIDWPWKKDD